MLTYEQALARILSQIGPLPPVPTSLEDMGGRVLAEDIVAPFDLPPFANSGMDGFAVRAEDIRPGVTLPLAGDIPAGALSVPALRPGQTLRIMTGAPLPPGADAVVPVEETETRVGGIGFLQSVAPGQCVRPAGEDVRAGEIVLRAGDRLRPAGVGLAAAVGRVSVLTHPRPTVALVSTGDELVPPGQPLQTGQIYNSNGWALGASVADAGGIVTRRVHAQDTAQSVREAFDECAGADVIISSGGVSVGEYDFVKAVFAERGVVDFWRVAIRPGKPLAFGRWGRTLFFGLPGNPVSSLVTFELFARPALLALQGWSDVTRPAVSARLTEAAAHATGRQSYLRGIVTREDEGYHARPLSQQGSGMLRGLVGANALLVLPPDVAALAPGERITALLLDSY